MRRLAINAVGDELEAVAVFCRSDGIGIEVTGYPVISGNGTFPSLASSRQKLPQWWLTDSPSATRHQTAGLFARIASTSMVNVTPPPIIG